MAEISVSSRDFRQQPRFHQQPRFLPAPEIFANGRDFCRPPRFSLTAEILIEFPIFFTVPAFSFPDWGSEGRSLPIKTRGLCQRVWGQSPQNWMGWRSACLPFQMRGSGIGHSLLLLSKRRRQIHQFHSNRLLLSYELSRATAMPMTADRGGLH